MGPPPRGPGDYTPVHGDASQYYEPPPRAGVSNAEQAWPADPHDPRMRFEPPPPPGSVDPWEGFTVHTAVAWGVTLLCVWLGLRWLGSRHERMTGDLNRADKVRAELEEEERKKKVRRVFARARVCVRLLFLLVGLCPVAARPTDGRQARHLGSPRGKDLVVIHHNIK